MKNIHSSLGSVLVRAEMNLRYLATMVLPLEAFVSPVAAWLLLPRSNVLVTTQLSGLALSKIRKSLGTISLKNGWISMSRSIPAACTAWEYNSGDHWFVCNMFQYFTVSYSICNIINIVVHWHPASHSYKMKTLPRSCHHFEQMIH